MTAKRQWERSSRALVKLNRHLISISHIGISYRYLTRVSPIGISYRYLISVCRRGGGKVRPPAYKFVLKFTFGERFLAGGPGEPFQPINLYQKWPLEVMSHQVAQGMPASVQIYTKIGLWKTFSGRWPGRTPPAYKSIRKVISGGHFPASRPGSARQLTNVYQNWPLEGVSRQVARGNPASLQIYTKSGLCRSSASHRGRQR